jgi:hypothetical protein
MAGTPAIREEDLQGFKYFKQVRGLLEKLHDAGCARDRAHNRVLHMDQHAALLLLWMFNPICSSLRALQQASELAKVQRVLGVPRASLGGLSEAARVFDADLLKEIIGELAREAAPLKADPRLGDLGAILTVVDGSHLSGLAELARALWHDPRKKGLQAHFQFELLRGPIAADLDHDNGNPREHLAEHLQKGRLYVLDRGFVKYELYRQITEAGSSYVARLKDELPLTVLEERPLSAQARAAGVLSDRLVRVGSKKPLVARVVEVRCSPHTRRGGPKSCGGPSQGASFRILTDRLDLSAEVIALIYKLRWQVEIFFRFFKHVLGCRHLLARNKNGIELQVYTAILACLLIALWTGRRPTLRTYEMFCYYLCGWASEDELTAHIGRLQKQG